MNWHGHRKTQSLFALLVGLSSYGAPSLAQVATPHNDAQELDRKLQESEQRIRLLQQRLEMLERRLEGLASSKPNPGPASQAAAPATARARPAAQAVSSPGANTATASSTRKPGTFEVDETAAQRALERTLTQTGALLLPKGSISITPSFSFTRTEQTSAELGEVTDAGGASSVLLVDNTLRRNEFAARAELKMGLPMDSQFELAVPFQHVRASRIDSFGDETKATGNGAGDVTIGLAKTLLQEKGALPDVIGRVTYNTGSGKRTDNRVNLGNGFRQLSGEVVALKRQDPLAFYAGLGYSHVFERGNDKPGDTTSLALGTVLAASPATSLEFGFTQIYRKESEVNGREVNGTEQTYGVVSIGASSILSRNVMLQTSVGFGVGDDAPKYSLNFALPIAFH